MTLSSSSRLTRPKPLIADVAANDPPGGAGEPKPEMVQHVTDLVKGEGIVSLISHTAEAFPPRHVGPRHRRRLAQRLRLLRR